MTFSTALCALKDGKKVTRRGWNGKGQFVYLVPGDKYPAKTDAAKSIADDKGMVTYRPYFALRTAQGDVATWVPSVSDCLADDWEVIEEEEHDADHSMDIIIGFLDALIDNIPVNESKCLACDRKDKCARWQKYVKEHTPSMKVEPCAKGTEYRKTEAKDKGVESK